MIKFRCDTDRLEQSIDRLKIRLVASPKLSDLLYSLQESHVTNRLKQRLLTGSTRDPLATPQGTGENTRIIAESIQTYITKTGRRIRVGSGKIPYMDLSDPLVGKNAKLWSILNFGAPPHLIFPSSKKRLYFYWYRYDTWTSREYVNHPGQIGRDYVSKAYYDASQSSFLENLYLYFARLVKGSF